MPSFIIGHDGKKEASPSLRLSILGVKVQILKALSLLTYFRFRANVRKVFQGIKDGSQRKNPMKNENSLDKLVFKLDEVSRITKLDPGVINSWEKEFYFLNAGETAAGAKIFRKKDLAIILRLKDLLEQQGLTLAGAKRKIEEEFDIKKSFHVHPDRLKKTLSRVRDQLQEIISALEK